MEALDIMANIQECFCAQLALGPNPPDQCCLVAGRPAIAECCAGVAWVRMKNIYPTSTFPARSQKAERCIHPVWAISIELGILRCAPETCGPLANPCCDAEFDAVVQLLADRDAMVRTLSCCLQGVPDAPQLDEIVFGSWDIHDATGGCIGSTMDATVRLLNSCAC